MTEPPALLPPETPAGPPPAPPPPSRPPQRARSRDVLPWFCAAGFLILAFALVWVWRHPAISPPTIAQADTQQIAALEAHVVRLEQQQPSATDLGPLTARIAALEQRPATIAGQPSKPPDLAPLEARIAALEQRPATIPGQPAKPPDLAPLEARIAAVEAKPPADSQAMGRVDALSTRVDALEAAQRKTAADQAQRLDSDETRLATIERNANQAQGLADRANRTARIQAAQMALDAGQKLGELPGAPAALARFATTAPPTEAALRQAFPAAARKAVEVARPATDGKPLLDRVWAEAQDLVTIRQGDRVLVGDPTAGVLARARTALDAGDLSGAVADIASLNGPAAQAMAAWLADARALLDARAALAQWAAHA